jgi:hypothetical protein
MVPCPQFQYHHAMDLQPKETRNERETEGRKLHLNQVKNGWGYYLIVFLSIEFCNILVQPLERWAVMRKSVKGISLFRCSKTNLWILFINAEFYSKVILMLFLYCFLNFRLHNSGTN